MLGSIPAGTRPEAGIWDTRPSQEWHIIQLEYSSGPSSVLRAARICQEEHRTGQHLEQNLGEQWESKVMEHRRNSGSLALLGHVVFPVVRTSHVLFQFTLEDLSVTLIRGGTNARQCFLSIPRPLLTPATIYWGENGYFYRGKGCRTSQLMPVNYLSPESNTFSWCQNYGHGELSSPTHIHPHTHWPKHNLGYKRTSADKHTHQQMPALSVSHCEKSDTPSICSCYS